MSFIHGNAAEIKSARCCAALHVPRFLVGTNNFRVFGITRVRNLKGRHAARWPILRRRAISRSFVRGKRSVGEFRPKINLLLLIDIRAAEVNCSSKRSPRAAMVQSNARRMIWLCATKSGRQRQPGQNLFSYRGVRKILDATSAYAKLANFDFFSFQSTINVTSLWSKIHRGV